MALVAALVASEVLSPVEARAQRRRTWVVLASAGRLDGSRLPATAAAIREHAPRTWRRAQEAFGWWGPPSPTAAQVVAQALLENALAVPVSGAPRTSELYPYDNFLRWRLRMFTRADIAQVRRELKPAARSWAEGSDEDAKDQARWVVPALRSVLRQTRQAARVAAPLGLGAQGLGRVLRAGGVGQSPPWPLAGESDWLRDGVERTVRKVASQMDAARRVVVLPALRPREIEKWLNALHRDLRLGLPWENESASGVSVVAGSLRGVPRMTRNAFGSFALTPPEADTMLLAAKRRLSFAESVLTARLEGASVGGHEPVDRIRALFSALEPIGEQVDQAAQASGYQGMDDPDPNVQCMIEGCLGRALAGFDEETRTLLDPNGQLGAANLDGGLRPGFWPILKQRLEALEAILDAHTDLEAWRGVVTVLVERVGDSGTPAAAQ